MELPSGRILPGSKKNLFCPLTVTRNEVFDRIVLPELWKDLPSLLLMKP
jgi:hypothetical protein